MEELYTRIHLPFAGAQAGDRVAVDISNVLVVRTYGNGFCEFQFRYHRRTRSRLSYPRAAINPFVIKVVAINRLPGAADEILKLTETGWRSPRHMRRQGLKPFLKLQGKDGYVPLDAHVDFELYIDHPASPTGES